MKKKILSVILLSMIAAGCSEEMNIESIVKESVEAQAPAAEHRFIGRFDESINVYRAFKNRIMIQSEQNEGFEVYSLDINLPSLHFNYKVHNQDDLLYIRQLNGERTIKVKQMGNGEENNVMVLEDKSPKNIAKRVAYSGNALVSVSPSQRHIVYCAAGDIQNNYNLYVYDIETEKSQQFMNAATEDLLNDMEGNIAWSPNNDMVVVSNKQVFDINTGRLIKEINGQSVKWAKDGSKLAYIRAEGGYGKAVCILDMSALEPEEVFITNQGEYLPGYMIWNGQGTKLAFATAAQEDAEAEYGAALYKAVYSLDCLSKEAVRVDTALQMQQTEIMNLQSLHYNAAGTVLTLVTENFSGNDLRVFNLNTEASSFYSNIEYLHDEDNEDYVCSTENNIYFVQNSSIIQLSESLDSHKIYQSAAFIEDVYVSSEGNTMLIIEKTEKGSVLRQLVNFEKKYM